MAPGGFTGEVGRNFRPVSLEGKKLMGTTYAELARMAFREFHGEPVDKIIENLDFQS